MTYDIEIYGAHHIDLERLGTALSDAGGRFDRSSGVAYRIVRGRERRVFVIDGPLGVEREDLPDEVAGAAVGVRLMYEFTVEDTARPSLAFATKAARALAAATDGLVHDRQNDARPIWSPAPLRRFKPPAAEHVDLLDLDWYVRREDLPHDLPERLLEALRTWFPEAMPRRFGDYEPLQHKLSDEGEEGFISAWRTESGGLFWKTSRPFFSGAARSVGDDFTPYLIGEKEQREGLPHPVANISLTMDLRVLSDERWRTDLVRSFARIAEVTGAFYAHAVVSRGWGYSGGSLWTAARTQTHRSVTQRDRWAGLPPYPVWLAWFKGFYSPGIEQCLGTGYERFDDGGLMWRNGDHPDDANDVPWSTATPLPEGL
ncbi:hypothetical protein E1264_28610 [Actinomadura sp. KC216]|uniref:hypothetical protein n=1 Tax=Actinomadura sp. KC216 TaxID=2530370 RepID=UPI00104E89C1|nr:hypothetical protein [Actinomadura sp. KC216]TDB83396.1 hypothetical protein E1264_28610 [Actinomadura sp. KC216]